MANRESTLALDYYKRLLESHPVNLSYIQKVIRVDTIACNSVLRSIATMKKDSAEYLVTFCHLMDITYCDYKANDFGGGLVDLFNTTEVDFFTPNQKLPIEVAVSMCHLLPYISSDDLKDLKQKIEYYIRHIRTEVWDLVSERYEIDKNLLVLNTI